MSAVACPITIDRVICCLYHLEREREHEREREREKERDGEREGESGR